MLPLCVDRSIVCPISVAIATLKNESTCYSPSLRIRHVHENEVLISKYMYIMFSIPRFRHMENFEYDTEREVLWLGRLFGVHDP